MTAQPTIRPDTGPPAESGPDAAGSLRDFYQDPQTTVASGAGRARRQLRMLAAVLERAGTGQRILDVGCGDGAATHLVRTAFPQHAVVGVDWSVMALRRAQQYGFPLVRGAVDPPGLPFADQCADVVIMSELIEHLVDTDSAVDEVHRVLRPGGVLLLSTPNLAAWYNRGLLAVGIQPVFSEVSLRGVYGRPGSEVVGHLRMFTRRALVGFLTARGFACERVAGAPYHDVPRPLRPLDRLFCHWPSAASDLLVQARRR